MSSLNNPPGRPAGQPASNPEAVLAELRQQAERKAAFRMFYSAADVFREYKGPYAAETASERTRLTEEYDQRGRDAEKQRLEGGPPPATPAVPKPAYRPPTPRPAPKPATATTPSSTAPKRPPTPGRQPLVMPFEIKDGQIVFACRWCHESLSFAVADAGQILRCPKCECLVSVPKP